MNILIVHNTLNDSKSVSGVLRHYAWMANEWPRRGHPTDFLAAKAGFPQLRDLAPKARLISSDSIFNATSYLAQTWRYFPAYAYRMLTAHATRLPVRYDIVYASTQLIVEVYAAMAIARRQRAKLAAKIHHVLAAQPQRGGFFDRLFLWSERKTARWLNAKGDLVICGTELVAQDFRNLQASLGLKPAPTRQIGYGIDLAAIEPGAPVPKEFDAVVLGRLHEHKGIFDLPAIWRLVVGARPGARLLIIGEGPHRGRLQEAFAEAGLREAAHFTGGIPEREKNNLLRKARLGISPSFEEGWGLSINEFLAASLPVVAYDLPIYHHVFPGVLNLAPVGSKETFARFIVELLRQEDLQKAQGQKGRGFVERYDFRNIALQELEALQSIASSRD